MRIKIEIREEWGTREGEIQCPRKGILKEIQRQGQGQGKDKDNVEDRVKMEMSG